MLSLLRRSRFPQTGHSSMRYLEIRHRSFGAPPCVATTGLRDHPAIGEERSNNRGWPATRPTGAAAIDRVWR